MREQVFAEGSRRAKALEVGSARLQVRLESSEGRDLAGRRPGYPLDNEKPLEGSSWGRLGWWQLYSAPAMMPSMLSPKCPKHAPVSDTLHSLSSSRKALVPKSHMTCPPFLQVSPPTSLHLQEAIPDHTIYKSTFRPQSFPSPILLSLSL